MRQARASWKNRSKKPLSRSRSFVFEVSETLAAQLFRPPRKLQREKAHSEDRGGCGEEVTLPVQHAGAQSQDRVPEDIPPRLQAASCGNRRQEQRKSGSRNHQSPGDARPDLLPPADGTPDQRRECQEGDRPLRVVEQAEKHHREKQRHLHQL